MSRAVRIKRSLTFPDPFGDWGHGEAGRLAYEMFGRKTITLAPGLVDLSCLRALCARERRRFEANRRARGQL